VASPGLAQLVPPTTAIQWVGPDNGDWATGGNWSSGTEPSSADEVRFNNQPSLLRPTVTLNANRTVSSLWFDAGKWFTLQGSGALTATSNADGYFVAVTSAGFLSHSEVNIGNEFIVENPTGWGRIRNDSEGGLGFRSRFYLDASGLRVEGRGATHFASTVANFGEGTPDIETHSYAADEQPHLIFSANNENWSGELRVGENTFVVVKASGALGTGANNVAGGTSNLEGNAWRPGTLAFRSHLAPTIFGTAITTGLDYTAAAQAISLLGDGITRREGVGPIGALYNDGGYNRYTGDIDFHWGDASIGARGDRQGGLVLDGKFIVKDKATVLTKRGTGLVSLGALATKTFTARTVIQNGVLRFSDATAPTDHILFEGGLFESSGKFTRSLGTGSGQVAWRGDGGFSAFGDALDVSISNGKGLATLTWDQDGFVPDASALLLSSRYATHNVTLHNAIDLNRRREREIHVERGVKPGFGGGADTVHAIIRGELSNGGVLKTGRGLLHLSNTANAYSGETVIREGALMGFDLPKLSLSGISPNSNIVLAGGVLMLLPDKVSYTGLLGTGAGDIRWAGSGGFAVWSASGGTPGIRHINFNEYQLLTWGVTDHFVGNRDELRFGHYTANGTVHWGNAIDLGRGNRTIRVERGRQPAADVAFVSKAGLRSTARATLNLVGDGHIATNISHASLLAHRINIYGAELRLFGKSGAIANRDKDAFYHLAHGGRLVLDNRDGFTPDDPSGGDWNTERIGHTSIYFNAGEFALRGHGTQTLTERMADLVMESGANAITIRAFGEHTELYAANLLRDEMHSRSTLLVTGGLNGIERLRLVNSAESLAINDFGGDKIMPWALNGRDWLTQGSNGYLSPLATYNFDAASTWQEHHNVALHTYPYDFLTNHRIVNSLRFSSSHTLNLMGMTLTIHSGGLMINGGAVITGLIGSYVMTGYDETKGFQRPLYIHTRGEGGFFGGATIGHAKGNVFDVVKTLPGTLYLGSSATHYMASLYIHQGTVDLQQGTINIARGGRITIGDGAGTAALKLPGNRWDPLTGDVNITLHGTPYDPRGPEYGGGQAILQLGGNTKQHIANLHIESRGTIDWVGGTASHANILWIDSLTFSGPDAQLFIRNWYQHEDILLVRRSGFSDADLPKIIFEGYQDYTTSWRHWDGDYYQIMPFNTLNIPEPATTGALLGALGTGLWLLRRRKHTPDSRPR